MYFLILKKKWALKLLDAKVKISVEDDYDDYDEIIDDEEVDEIVDNVDENYLNN